LCRGLIEPIIQAFRPSQNEIGKATGILLKAANASWGPIEYGGALHDRASFRYYYNVIKQAQASGVTIAPELAEVLNQN
jgi:citrate lyase subunit beta/citryl-CoA lyase